MARELNILIVEDDAIIALGLELAALDSGVQVLGPFSTTSAALTAIDNDHPNGAVLDCDLWDGPVDPVARRLLASGIPVVFHSAQSIPAALKAEFPGVILIDKPAPPLVVVTKLLELTEVA